MRQSPQAAADGILPSAAFCESAPADSLAALLPLTAALRAAAASGRIELDVTSEPSVSF